MENLAPAGNREALERADAAGADAVYLGYAAFSARAGAGNFDRQELEEAIRYAHLRHMRVHVTVNTLVKDGELEAVTEVLRLLRDLHADAVLVQDLGVLRIARRCFPGLTVHASTQMAIHNRTGVDWCRKQGILDRVQAHALDARHQHRMLGALREEPLFADEQLLIKQRNRPCIVFEQLIVELVFEDLASYPKRGNRAVSPEEARISRERLTQWAKNPPASNGGLTGEWIFEATRLKNNKSARRAKRLNETTPQKPISAEEIIRMSQSVRLPVQQDKIEASHEYPSLTSNVVQVYWKTPTEFPLCPQERVEKPLMEYKTRLTPGSVFCQNEYTNSLVIDSALVDSSSALIVMCQSSDEGALKPWSLAKITYSDGKYYHESIQTYFHEDGAKKYFTLAQGKEWTGGEVFDDLV